MVSNKAIIIGVNEYINGPTTLQYAEQDAIAMKAFLESIGFNEILLLTSSLKEEQKSTSNNLVDLLERFKNNPRQNYSSSLWFFFAGHGVREEEQDFLLLSNSWMSNVKKTAVSVDEIIRSLRRCTENLVVILDMCRTKSGSREGDRALRVIGDETLQAAREPSVTTLFACEQDKSSYEIPRIESGVFTCALLEALKDKYQPHKTTAYELVEPLTRRVNELLEQHQLGNSRQTPWSRIESPQPLTQNLVIELDFAKIESIAIRHRENNEYDRAIQQLKIINEFALDSETRSKAFDNAIEIAKEQQSSLSLATLQIDLPPISVVELSASAEIESKLISEPTIAVGGRSTVTPMYLKLQQLLNQEKWQEADRETYEIIIKKIICEELQLRGRENLGRGLTLLSHDHFESIDQLWTSTSQGRFGFSIQRSIYQRICQDRGKELTREYDGISWELFADRIGWRNNNEWLTNHNQFNFSPYAPDGHLPSPLAFGLGKSGVLGKFLGEFSFPRDSFPYWNGFSNLLINNQAIDSSLRD